MWLGTRFGSLGRATPVILSVLLFVGCSGVHQEDVGSAQMAVLSVARWEKYEATVQPNFALSTDQAFAQAIPDTAALTSKTLSSFAAQFSAQLSPAASNPSAAASPDVNSLPGILATDPSKLGTDPMLRYWTATALYEEVQLLNRYVKDAAIAGEYYPYVVRMQITLMPQKRNLPYDAYCSVAFFNDDFADYPPARRFMKKETIDAMIEGLKCEDPDSLRKDLFSQIEKTQNYREALSRDAIYDGLDIAIHTDKCPATQPVKINPHDIVDTALAYARERSPRFVGFRGLNPADYVDTEMFHVLASCEYKKGHMADLWKIGKKSELKPPLDGYAVSAEDFELSLNEDWSALRSLDGGTWKCRAKELVCEQAEHGATYRPFVGSPRPSTPLVIPLLVTDNLEAAVESRSAEQTRQLAIVLAVMAGKANLQGSLSNYDAELRSALGRSLNSTFTIGRESDNTIRVRFGAGQQATDSGGQPSGQLSYAMIPEAHNVTLLVLVPKVYVESVGQPMIHLQMNTSFVDVKTGKTLASQKADDEEEIKKILEDNDVVYRDKLVEKLSQAAWDNDFEDFQALLGGPANSAAEAIWVQVQDVYNQSPLDYSTVRLPKPSPPRLDPLKDESAKGNLSATAIDDTKKVTTVLIRGTGDLFSPNISGELWVTEPPPAAPPVPASIQVDLQNASTTKPSTLTLSTTRPDTVDVTTTQPTEIDWTPNAQGPGAQLGAQQSGTVKLVPATMPAGGSTDIRVTTAQPETITVQQGDPGSIKLTMAAAASVRTRPMSPTAQAINEPAKTTVLYSTTTTVLDDGRTIQFTFPSLAASNLVPKGGSPKQLQVKARFFDSDGQEEYLSGGETGIRNLEYIVQKPPSLPISLTAHAKMIDAKSDGTGDVIIDVTGYDPTKTTAKFFLTVDGADVESAGLLNATGTQFVTIPFSSDATEAGKIPINANGVIQLSLENLNPVANVTISAEDGSGGKLETSITLVVDRASSSASTKQTGGVSSN
jgi:hypothetical protein